MALLNKTEFRAACGGMAQQYLNTYIKREKVFVREDGLIDDSFFLNAEFKKSRLAKVGNPITVEEQNQQDIDFRAAVKAGKKPSTIKKVEVKVEEVKEEKPKKVNNTKETTRQYVKKAAGKQQAIDYEPGNISEMDREKHEIELKIKRKELELKEIEVKKKMGEVIPVDMVKGLISRHSKNYVSSFNTGATKLVDEIKYMLGASREESSKLKGQMIDLINEAIDNAIETTEAELSAIVNEYKSVK